MFTVALVGPDGAGKSTIVRRLVKQDLSLPVKYVYMGINPDASNLLLPTTRLMLAIKRGRGRRPDMGGPPDPTRVKVRPQGVLGRAAAGLKSSLRLANLMAEEWFRQGLIWYYQRRGYIVLFDRHFFFDYYAHDIANNGVERPLTSRIHGFVLERFYPRPDLVICLDAPAEVLFRRKGEGTLELLELRRQEYLKSWEQVTHFVTVDATQSEDDVTREVVELVQDFYRTQLATQ